jgi:hypothetical protein
MATDFYHFEQNETTTQFVFFSEGQQGRIMKAIIFSLYDRHRWNIAFGDVGPTLEVDDKAISNNNDALKVLRTVAATAIAFSEKYPERSLVVFPVDEKRKRLYNLLFRRQLEEIQTIFDVYGKLQKRWSAYNSDFEYDAFEFSRKKR